MEKKEQIKVSLSTFFLIIAIIVIAVMGYFMYKLYNEKIATEEKVKSLNNQVNSLQEKINSISNIINSNVTNKNTSGKEVNNSSTSKKSNEEKYDIEITPDDVSSVYTEWQNTGHDMNVFKKFNEKYIGKLIKVTGSVDYYEISNRIDYDYAINIVDDSLDRVYATCLTNDKGLGLTKGQEVTIIGTYMDDPNIMTLKDIKIVEK